MRKENVFAKERFAYKKVSPYDVTLIIDFLDGQDRSFSFSTQNELYEYLKAFVNDNMEKYDKVPDQPTISRALPFVMEETFFKDEQTYGLVKVKKNYFFIPKETSLTNLFELDIKYLKESVHALSNNTLVFCFDEGKHQIFVNTIKASFSSSMLWGNYSQGDYLFLMFDDSRADWESNFKIFKKFFVRRTEYERFNMLSKNIK